MLFLIHFTNLPQNNRHLSVELGKYVRSTEDIMRACVRVRSNYHFGIWTHKKRLKLMTNISKTPVYQTESCVWILCIHSIKLGSVLRFSFGSTHMKMKTQIKLRVHQKEILFKRFCKQFKFASNFCTNKVENNCRIVHKIFPCQLCVFANVLSTRVFVERV